MNRMHLINCNASLPPLLHPIVCSITYYIYIYINITIHIYIYLSVCLSNFVQILALKILHSNNSEFTVQKAIILQYIQRIPLQDCSVRFHSEPRNSIDTNKQVGTLDHPICMYRNSYTSNAVAAFPRREAGHQTPGQPQRMVVWGLYIQTCHSKVFGIRINTSRPLENTSKEYRTVLDTYYIIQYIF